MFKIPMMPIAGKEVSDKVEMIVAEVLERAVRLSLDFLD